MSLHTRLARAVPHWPGAAAPKIGLTLTKSVMISSPC
jgi:hypothetical protein